jgi:hypothetical protein
LKFFRIREILFYIKEKRSMIKKPYLLLVVIFGLSCFGVQHNTFAARRGAVAHVGVAAGAGHGGPAAAVSAGLHESIMIGSFPDGVEGNVNGELSKYRDYVNNIQNNLPEISPNVAVGMIFLRKPDGTITYFLIPSTFISGWSLATKYGPGAPKNKWTAPYLKSLHRTHKAVR